MQERAHALSHIDLVLSQLSVEVLHNLQSSVTQEIQLRAEMTTMELAKVNEDNATLQVEYSRLVQERDEAVNRDKKDCIR
jgi:FtsZ-binding cell division protein ZapB